MVVVDDDPSHAYRCSEDTLCVRGLNLGAYALFSTKSTLFHAKKYCIPSHEIK